MRGYRFRLQPVLRVRQLQEEQSRVELAMARRAEDEAHAATATRRSRFVAARHAPLEDPTPLAATRRRDRQRRMLDALVASQVAEAHASDLRRRSQEDWEAAVVALRTMERLDERARAEHRLEMERLEQIDLDELATSRAGIPDRSDPDRDRTDVDRAARASSDRDRTDQERRRGGTS